MDDVLYAAATPVKGLPIVPMEVDGATPRKIEAMDLDLPETTPATPLTPQRGQNHGETLLNDDFLHLTISKVLGISLRAPDRGSLALSTATPDHPLLSNISKIESHTVETLIMEGMDLIISGSSWAKVLVEEGSPITCLHYLVYCMLS